HRYTVQFFITLLVAIYNFVLCLSNLQSTAMWVLLARHLIGNRDVSYQSESCTLTNVESNPWRRVDLVNVYKIGAVIITNRMELENRLDGAEIWIGNSSEISDHESMSCAVISHIPNRQTFYFPCRSEKVLSLCELEVYYGQLLYNLALKRPAVQSSTSGPWGTAGRAVDGNRDASYQRGSCTLTSGQSNPWWRVDLVNVYTIGAVMIINRDEMENRLDGAEIWIGNSTSISNSKSIRCAVISHIPKGQCNEMEGRYVIVIIPGIKRYMTLCEVEVFASLSGRVLGCYFWKFFGCCLCSNYGNIFTVVTLFF
uniref:Si:ch73-359m17.2 n=1 Tax=Neolamprologus brichardi TaxID=32507 RepID=A0A3Q4GZZ9_NEOBR